MSKTILAFIVCFGRVQFNRTSEKHVHGFLQIYFYPTDMACRLFDNEGVDSLYPGD